MTDPFDLDDFNNRLAALNARQHELDLTRNALRTEILAECIKYCAMFGFTAKELKLTQPAVKSKPSRTSKHSDNGVQG